MPAVAKAADEFYLWDSTDISSRRLLASKPSASSPLEVRHEDAYVYADFDEAGQKVKRGGRPTARLFQNRYASESPEGKAIESFDAGQSIEDIATGSGMSKDRIFNVVTTGVIDPNMQYRPPVQPSSRPLISPEKKIDDFVSDDALESTWESLTPAQQSIVKDVLNKTPGAMDAFENEDLPMDIIIWAAQNGISGRMGALPIDGFKRYRSAEERSKKPPTFRGKPWTDVKESLGGQPWPFKGQASQFDKKGPPGLSYFKGTGNGLQPGQWVDCLLWRDEKGILKGIAYHYPQDLPLEKKGNLNIFISPDSKRQGIASKLVAEAINRYNVDLRQQRYSAEGAAFVNNFVRNLPENSGGQVSGRMATRYDKDRYSSEDIRDAILDVYGRGLQVSDALEALRNEYDILMDRTDWTARMTRYRKAGILDSFRLPNKNQAARKIEKSLTQKFIDKRNKEIQRLVKARPNLTNKEIAEIINRMPIPDGVNVTRMTTSSVANILRKGA